MTSNAQNLYSLPYKYKCCYKSLVSSQDDDSILGNGIYVIFLSKPENYSKQNKPCQIQFNIMPLKKQKNGINENSFTLQVKSDRPSTETIYCLNKEDKSFILVKLTEYPISSTKIMVYKDPESVVSQIGHIYVNKFPSVSLWSELLCDLLINNEVYLGSDTHYIDFDVNLYSKKYAEEPTISNQNYCLYYRKEKSEKSLPYLDFLIKDSTEIDEIEVQSEINLERAEGVNTPEKNEKTSEFSSIKSSKLSTLDSLEETNEEEENRKRLSSANTEGYGKERENNLLKKQETLSKLKSIKLEKKFKGAGLINSQMNCYLNSDLQVLFNTPLFVPYFLERYHNKETNSKSASFVSKIFGLMLETIQNCYQYPTPSEEALDLDDMMRLMRVLIFKETGTFERGTQNDSIEFLKCFLGCISGELNRITNKPLPRKIPTTLFDHDLQSLSDQAFNNTLSRENSIVTDLFSGQLVTIKTCRNCSCEEATFEDYWELSLSFKRTGSKVCNLEDLIRGLEEEQDIHGDECNVCCSEDIYLKPGIWRLPEILIFTFKRFRNGNQKITDQVKFPVKSLDMGSFISKRRNLYMEDTTYTLYGIVEHSGTPSGGHYTAMSRNLYDGKWYDLNDQRIEKSKIKNDFPYHTCCPSILFYVKSTYLD